MKGREGREERWGREDRGKEIGRKGRGDRGKEGGRDVDCSTFIPTADSEQRLMRNVSAAGGAETASRPRRLWRRRLDSVEKTLESPDGPGRH